MTEADILEARRHLAAADPLLADVIARVGGCTLRPSGRPFETLARAIVGQQVSVHAAAAIWGRFAALCGAEGDAPTPGQVLVLPEERLREAGLSRSKAAYVRDLAARVLDGTVPADMDAVSDEEIIGRLTTVKGIGRWTAEMFLIFGLGRPDVLPVDDLGFRIAVQQAYGFPDKPGPSELRALAEPWRPWRSVATWYLWQSRRLARH